MSSNSSSKPLSRRFFLLAAGSFTVVFSSCNRPQNNVASNSESQATGQTASIKSEAI